MATKPVTQPERWAIAGVYVASNYPALLPWGAAHPQAGNPTPWSLQARRSSAGLAGYANTGGTPLLADPVELDNEQKFRIAELSRWVFAGSTAATADAHILETDGTGLAQVTEFQVPGVFSASTVGGVIICSSKVTLSDDVTLAATKSITGDIDSTIKTGVFAGDPGASSTVNGSWFVDAEGCLIFFLVAEKRVHMDATGFFVAEGELLGTTGPGVLVNVTTSTQTNPPTAAGAVKVECTGRVRRTILGQGTLELQESEGGVIWLNVSGPTATFMVDNALGGEYTHFRIRATFSPGDTNPRFYRCVVDSNGSMVTTVEAMIRAGSHW